MNNWYNLGTIEKQLYLMTINSAICVILLLVILIVICIKKN